DGTSGKQLFSLKASDAVRGLDAVKAVACTPDGSWIASGNWDKSIKVWDGRSGKRLLSWAAHPQPVSGVAMSADGSRLASCDSLSRSVKVWDGQTGKELLSLEGHSYIIVSVAWSADGLRVVTGSWDKTARVWDARTGKELLSLVHPESVTSVAW